MKKLILDVRCLSEYDDVPENFIVELTEQKIEQIKSLANVLKENEAYSIALFDYDGEYFSDLTLESLTSDSEEGRTADELTESMVAEMDDCVGNVDVPQLVVYKDGFKFTCVPKHCGDEDLCRTDIVPLTELDNGETYSKAYV